MTRSGFATAFLPLVLVAAASAAPSRAAADEPGTPQTIKVAAAEPIEEGAAGDRQSTFVLVHTDANACFAIAPPGGEGMEAGEAYIVVAANGVDDALKQKLEKDHPGCKLVDVVARAMKP